MTRIVDFYLSSIFLQDLFLLFAVATSTFVMTFHLCWCIMQRQRKFVKQVASLDRSQLTKKQTGVFQKAFHGRECIWIDCTLTFQTAFPTQYCIVLTRKQIPLKMHKTLKVALGDAQRRSKMKSWPFRGDFSLQ